MVSPVEVDPDVHHRLLALAETQRNAYNMSIYSVRKSLSGAPMPLYSSNDHVGVAVDVIPTTQNWHLAPSAQLETPDQMPSCSAIVMHNWQLPLSMVELEAD